MEQFSVNLTSLLEVLPSVHRLFQAVERDLQDGRSVWVLCPQGVRTSALANSLLRYLEGSGGMFVDVVGLDTAGGCAPFEVLRQVVARWEDVGQCRILEDLTFSLSPQPEVLLIQSIEDLPSPERMEWIRAVERWTTASKMHTPAQRRKLCIVALAEFLNDMPQLDVAVSVRTWWGIPSALETRLACRLASQENKFFSLWREHLIPSLAGDDLALGEDLWDVITESEDRILECLARYGMKRGWQKENAKEASEAWKTLISARGNAEASLSRQEFPLWARGWIVYTPEYGREIHSALVALLEDEQEIRHRLWRAQAALLLPKVDSVRISICDQLTQAFGSTWTSWADEWEISPYPELGAIESALRKGPILEPMKQRWLRVVRLVRETRNKLAHYKPISFQEFTEFWERTTPY